MHSIIVVGAGISGLCAAHRFLQATRDVDPAPELLLLEAGPHVGGKIYTEPVDGYLCEWGPDGFLDNAPATLELVRELGLTDRLVRANAEAGHRRYLLLGGRLVQLPTSPPGFLTSPMLPLGGRLRAMLEPFIPRRRASVTEESVYAFASRRLGPAVARIMVDALVTGIYGGDPNELSVDAAFPKLRKLEAQHGSLVRGGLAQMLERRRARKAAVSLPAAAANAAAPGQAKGLQTGPSGVLTSLQGGLSTLTGALADRIGRQRIRTGASVEALTCSQGRLAVVLTGGERLQAEHVVLALPARQARALTGGLSAPLADALEPFPTAPIAVVCLGLRREQVGDPLAGFGFLVPGEEGLPMLGCLFSTSIYPGRAPQGHVLLRTMLGGRRHPQVVDETEPQIARRAMDILRPLLRIEGEPTMVRVIRHKSAIPQYTLGHLQRVAQVERLAAPWPGLHLAGNAYHGVGLNDCIRNGLELGRTLASKFTAAAAAARP